jgi:uncharacterized protein (UPF0335 family)
MTARIAKDHLKSFVERIERLEEDKKCLADDIKDIYAEAKSNGYDVKALRAVIRLRKVDKDEQDEFDAIVDTYKQALGMLPADDDPQAAAAAHLEQAEKKRRRKQGAAAEMAEA